jgi:hypothetical protein
MAADDGHSSPPLWIVTPSAAPHLIREGSRTWCYLGTSITTRNQLRDECGDDVDVGVALTDTALSMKQPFLDWLAEIGRHQTDAVRWWASATASKSPLQSDLFFLACYGEAMASWAAGGAPAEVIVVEDVWLWTAARQWFEAHGRTRFIRGAASQARDALRLRLLALRRTLTFIASSASTVIAARRRFSRQLPSPTAHRVLMFTWIEPRAFGAGGTFTDAYTGRLQVMLAAHGAQVTRFTPLLVPRTLWPAIRSTAGSFIVTPAFARLRDVIRAAFARFHIDLGPATRMFRNRDHAALLERERLHERASLSRRQHHLWHSTIRRIAASINARHSTVIYPFENQPHEKLLCLAWREGASTANLAGYVTAGIPSLLISFFLGNGEAAFQPLPDTIVTNGAASRDLLAANGYPAERVVDGGAFRFEHLEPLAALDERALRTSPARVLVALSTVERYARALVEALIEACREPLVDPATGTPVTFVITFHVDLPQAAVVKPSDRVPETVTFSDDSVAALLDNVDLFLFVPPTGSWREAYAAGVPILRYRPDTLDLDPIDALGGVELPACSRATLRTAVAAGLASRNAAPRAERERMLRRTYSPVREEVWLALSGLTGKPLQ